MGNFLLKISLLFHSRISVQKGSQIHTIVLNAKLRHNFFFGLQSLLVYSLNTYSFYLNFEV